jgi:hypothetical protein
MALDKIQYINARFILMHDLKLPSYFGFRHVDNVLIAFDTLEHVVAISVYDFRLRIAGYNKYGIATQIVIQCFDLMS